MQLKIGWCYRAKRKHPLLRAFLDSLINHCSRLFTTCVLLMWFEVLHRVLTATMWLSLAPHPAERAFQDCLLHFNRYQAGHQARQCVVDNRREGGLVRKQREVWKVSCNNSFTGVKAEMLLRHHTLNSAMSCSKLTMSCCTQGSLAS